MSQREKIIDRTAKMFLELGIKSIRMDDIAHSLGISKRTLYEMFADKEELIYLCMKHLFDDRFNRANKVPLENGGEFAALFRGFELMLDTGDRHHRMMTNLQKFYPSIYDRVKAEHIREGVNRIRDIITDFVRRGLISSDINVDLSVTIFYYITTVVFAQRNSMVLPEGVTEKDAFMYTIVNFFRGAATEEGVHQIDRFISKKRVYDI